MEKSEKVSLCCGENQVETAEQDEDAADFFQDDRSFGFFVPVHVALDKLGAGSGENNHGAMAHAVDGKQGDAVGQAC